MRITSDMVDLMHYYADRFSWQYCEKDIFAEYSDALKELDKLRTKEALTCEQYESVVNFLISERHSAEETIQKYRQI